MAKSTTIASTAQAQVGAQVSAPVSTNAVPSFVKLSAKANELDIIARNRSYDDSTQMAGKHYARVRFTPSNDNSDLNEIIDQIDDEKFEGDFVFIICEEDKQDLIEAIDTGSINSLDLRISLRESESTGIVSYSVRYGKSDDEMRAIKRDELAVRRQELEARKSLATAKAKFYGSSKMDSIFTESLAQELQMKF